MANTRLRSGRTLSQRSNGTRRSSARLQGLVRPALALSEPTNDGTLVPEVIQNSASESNFEDPNDSDYSDFANLDEAQRVTPPWRSPSPIECRTRSFRSKIQKSAPAVGKKPHTPWQKWEDRVLTSRYAAGHDYEVIRKELRDLDVGAMKRRRLKLQTEELYPGEVFSSGKEWTEEENQKLIRLRNEGQPFTKICLELSGELGYSLHAALLSANLFTGRSAEACSQRFTLVLGSDSWKPEEDKQLLASIRDGVDLQQIANDIGNRSATECAYRWERLKPKLRKRGQRATSTGRKSSRAKYRRKANPQVAVSWPPRKPWTQKDRKKLKSLFDMGKTWEEISTQLSRTLIACLRYFKRQFPALDPTLTPCKPQSQVENTVTSRNALDAKPSRIHENQGLVEDYIKADLADSGTRSAAEEIETCPKISIGAEDLDSEFLDTANVFTMHSSRVNTSGRDSEDNIEDQVTDKVQEWLEGNQNDDGGGAASEDSQRPVLSPSYTDMYSDTSSESSDKSGQEENFLHAQSSLHPSRQASLARHILGNFEAQNRKLQMLESDILAHLRKIKPPQAKRGSLPTDKPPPQQQEGGSVTQPATSPNKDRPVTKRTLPACESSEPSITNEPPVKKCKLQSLNQPSWHEQLIACASDNLSRPDALKAQSCMGNRQLVARTVPEQRSCMANQQLLTPKTSPRNRESRQMKLQSENSTRSNGNAKDQPIEIESDIEEAEDANEIYRRFSISRN